MRQTIMWQISKLFCEVANNALFSECTMVKFTCGTCLSEGKDWSTEDVADDYAKQQYELHIKYVHGIEETIQHVR